MASSSPPRAAAHSSSSDARTSTTSVPGTARSTGRIPPRSIPPWIASPENRHSSIPNEQRRLLSPTAPEHPAPARPAQHNATPSDTERRVSQDGFVDWDDTQLGPAQGSRARIPHFMRYGRASMRGRKWDHLRSAEPPIIPRYGPTNTQPAMDWAAFIHSSSWGLPANQAHEIVDYEVLNKLQPTFNQPSRMPLHPQTNLPGEKRPTPLMQLWRFAFRHSLAPLVFRLTVMVTSIVALGVAGPIYQLENAKDRDSAERTQSVVAIAVDSLAIPYIAYMIWDEYTGKPLGLRTAVSKISLILLDLFFIIFKSASTALAFESLIYHNVGASMVRELARVLAAFMLIGLIAWTMNFLVNVFRTVERLGGGEEDSHP